ncbi:MAG: hypothetical protein AAB066_01980 [Candidatus Margulisiibacteriota bacterium]
MISALFVSKDAIPKEILFNGFGVDFCSIETATAVCEAAELLQAKHIDVVITELSIAHGSGFDILQLAAPDLPGNNPSAFYS